MAIERQSATVQPGQSKTFTFSNTVTQKVAGISGFLLSYGGGDHHVQEVDVALSVSQSGNTVTVQANAVMHDGSGHHLDPRFSWLTIVVVAWTTPNADNLLLANSSGIQNGSRSGPIGLPSSTLTLLQAVLAGFELAYGSGDHHVEIVRAGVGTEQDNTSGYITGSAQMQDSSGNNAATATVDGGMIASSDAAPGFQVQATDNLQKNTAHLSFGASTKIYVPLLTGFQVDYPGDHDHHVRTFSTKIDVTPSGSQVAVSGSATISDSSGHSQNNSNSYVRGIVIGF